MVSRRWDEIAAELRAAINQGCLRPGDQLTTCAALMAQYGAARATIQAAIEALRTEGLVTTRRGLGWYVQEPPEVIRLARNGLSRSRHRAGFLACAQANEWRPDDVVTTVRTVPAGADVAAELGLNESSVVLVLDSAVSISGQVVQLTTSYLPRSMITDEAVEAAVARSISASTPASAKRGPRCSHLRAGRRRPCN